MSYRPLIVSALAAAAAFAGAQGIPHVVTLPSSELGVLFNVQGGQREYVPGLPLPRILRSTDGLFSPENGGPFFRQLGIDLNKPTPAKSDVWIIHRCDPGNGGGGGGGGGAVLSINSQGATGFNVPSLDSRSRTPSFFDIFLEEDSFNVDSTFTRETQPERKQINRQKAWLPSNFRIEIGGSAARVNKIDSFTVKQSVADLDGDGVLDLDISNLVMTVSFADSTDFFAWFEGVSQGKPDVREVALHITANDGSPLCTITAQMLPRSVDFFDVFLEFLADPGDVRVEMMQKGTVKFFNEAKGFG